MIMQTYSLNKFKNQIGYAQKHPIVRSENNTQKYTQIIGGEPNLFYLVVDVICFIWLLLKPIK